MFLDTLKHILGRITIITINQLAVLISLPILASRLDFYNFGQIAIGFLLVQLTWLISDWGIQNYSIETWRNLGGRTQECKFTSSVVTLNLLIAILTIFLILGLIQLKVLDFPIKYFFYILPSIIMGSLYPLWFFQVQKSPQDMILPTFISRLIFLGMIFIFVADNQSASWAFLAQGLNLSLITIYAFFRMYTHYSFKWHFPRIKTIKEIAQKSFPFFINAVTNNQINTFWSFGLSIIAGPAAMALFNLGEQIYRAGGAMTNVIAQSVRIYFIGKTVREIGFTVLFFIFLFITISLTIFITADFFINKFFSTEYLPAIKIIKLMIIAWGIQAVIKLLNYPILGETHGSEWVNKITYKILFLHALAFLFWMFFLSGPLSLAVVFLSVIGCQLIIFLFYFFLKTR